MGCKQKERRFMGVSTNVALVDETGRIPAADLSRVAAALSKQVANDFAPVWGIKATVSAFPNLASVPSGHRPIIVQDRLDEPGALGYHTDKNGQPYALVMFTHSYSLTCSHELLEMLADPLGNNLLTSRPVARHEHNVQYLVEVCDPCEDANFAYTIDGVLVSDFYTPAYFQAHRAPGTKYDFTGHIEHPRQVLRGGYLSWLNLDNNHIEQEVYFGIQPEVRDLGDASQRGGMSLREFVDSRTEHPGIDTGLPTDHPVLVEAVEKWKANGEAAEKAAERLRQELADLG
jgi:hypothetical protein